MAELDRKRRGELLYAVFEVLAQHPDGIQAKDALALVEQSIQLTDYEKANYPGTEVRRFEKTIRFQTINAVKAGWMVKEKGIWTATPDGLSARQQYQDPEQFMLEAEQLYRAWRKEQPATEPAEAPEEPEATASVTLETAEETAWAEVRKFLAEMDPYDFQQLVAGLLRGMGYEIDHVAPPGKDRGVDIIAQTDPLGTRGPRIKVQVKREQEKTNAQTLRAFMSVLKDNDVGVFVTLGGFTSDAEAESRTEARRITLIDSFRFFDLWVRHYAAIPEEDKLRLPIKPIHFLAKSSN